MKKKLPIGIDDFKELRQEDFYYMDKTGFIGELLNNWGKVNLFTRPHRFGKTLNMSMLKSFFEIGADKSLFDGLAISKDTALCDEYLGKYPVIFISFKDVDGLRFDNARSNLINKIGTEAERFSFLLDSNHLSQNEKDKYSALISLEKGEYTMNETMLSSSLNLLSSLLYKHFNKKVIILIDEYDVPCTRLSRMDTTKRWWLSYVPSSVRH